MKAAIGELADIQIGYPVREGLETSPKGTHYVIQAKDIQADLAYELTVSDIDRFTPDRNPGVYTVKSGDVLFLARGRRRSASVIEALPETLPVIALYYFFILRLKEGSINAHFLSWMINEGPAKEYLARVASGTTIPFVTKQAFAALELELPVLKKQEDIAAVYRLSMREARLRRRLELSRLELMRLACQNLFESHGSTA